MRGIGAVIHFLTNTWQHISPRFQRDVEQYQGLVRPVCSG